MMGGQSDLGTVIELRRLAVAGLASGDWLVILGAHAAGLILALCLVLVGYASCGGDYQRTRAFIHPLKPYMPLVAGACAGVLIGTLAKAVPWAALYYVVWVEITGVLARCIYPRLPPSTPREPLWDVRWSLRHATAVLVFSLLVAPLQ